MTADYQLVIPAGTDCADAIRRLLFMGRRHEDYGVELEDTGVATPKLRYRRGSDWLGLAHGLARSVGMQLWCCPDPAYGYGVYRLMRVDSGARHLADELASILGWARVDAMFGSPSSRVGLKDSEMRVIAQRVVDETVDRLAESVGKYARPCG